MTIYMAAVRNKETRELEVITREYETKKEFEHELRVNGYSIRFISTPEKFDENCEKWHAYNDYCKMYHKVRRDAAKKFAV